MTPALRCTFALFLLSLCSPLSTVAQLLPDLIPEVSNLQADFQTSVSAGDVAEECASATTGVDLLRFSVFTRNIGTADLTLGDPDCPDCHDNPGAICGNVDFHCSPAGGHNHGHYSNYARYDLLDSNNQVVAVSGKFGFCLADTSCPPGTSFHYNCGYQGLTVGCGDLYSFFLGCQYIDITPLPSGNYTLRITVDPLNQIAELDETNNVTTLPVSFDRDKEPDAEIPGNFVELSRQLQASRFHFRFFSKSTVRFSMPGPEHAPTALGATLILRDTAAPPDEKTTIYLPQDRWIGLGSPAGAKGYRYRSGPSSGDECSLVELKPTGITATCNRFVAPPTLPIQGQLSVQIHSGESKRYCATLGGNPIKNSTTIFKRKNAPAAPCSD
ncbi:MAG: hypothetical protein HYZ50_05410 [Deltaproteobacteria bacterium]|nr:hypothetical protein [Deltaproteobacteria bacterium]